MDRAKQGNNKPIQLQVALIPVCKMVIRFGLHFHEFIRNLQVAYIKAAEEILSESNRKPNFQSIAIKTGMDRRTISEYKNNDQVNYTNPLNKMDMLIIQLQIYCGKKTNGQLTIEQLQIIIDSIYAQHIRSGAIINELLSNNIIKKLEDNTYKINFTLQQQLSEISMMADEVDYTAKRLFQTYYRNMFYGNESNKNKLLQSSCLSSKIAPRHHNKVQLLVKKELEKSQSRIINLLQKHESNVVENTYPEIGISQFQFSSNND